MIKKLTTVWFVVSCLLLAPVGAVSRPQAFSADFVITSASGKPNRRLGHVYVAGGKVRIETPDIPDGFFVVEGDHPAAWFVRPRQQLYMEARQSSPLTQLLVPVDPESPCRQWQVMEQVSRAAEQHEEWRCELLGSEVLDGRDTLKYLATSPQQHWSLGWIDPQHEFPIKVETDSGFMVTLRNIVEAPQASSLFAIPPGYGKFDPAQLLERVKQSDVWVEPPH